MYAARYTGSAMSMMSTACVISDSDSLTVPPASRSQADTLSNVADDPGSRALPFCYRNAFREMPHFPPAVIVSRQRLFYPKSVPANSGFPGNVPHLRNEGT